MNMQSHSLKFITPLFSRGIVEKSPEIRSPSIRGQLHWWFRALGGEFEDEKKIFGSVGRESKSSRIVVRVKHDPLPSQAYEGALLLHEDKWKHSQKTGIAPGTTFDFVYFLRRDFPEHERERLTLQLKKCVQTWLLLGSLGMRATRGSGSFLCEGVQPLELSEYQRLITQLIKNAPLSVFCSQTVYDDPEHARADITNTIKGLEFRNSPLGFIGKGKRKTSPLRLTVRSFNDGYRIIAVWDDRRNVTGNTFQDLCVAIQKLSQARKPLGSILPTERVYWINGKS